MWSSIKQIIKPDSFSEALLLQKKVGSELFAGGSYLVSIKDQSINTLIDINHLLSDDLINSRGSLKVGAGITLQELLEDANPDLTLAISSACPSKNIRNQRTLGGEIAQARPDSDLLVYLYAAEAKLHLNESSEWVHIDKWDGSGIISMILIPTNTIKLERVSVLDSAMAYVIVAVKESEEQITLAVGGKSSKILSCKSSNTPDEDQIRTFMDNVESIYEDDHFGSSAYKRQLVSNLLKEMTVTQ